MKVLGIVLMVLGVLMLAGAGISASTAPNFSYLVGTFLPGLAALIIGLKLSQTKQSRPASRRRDNN